MPDHTLRAAVIQQPWLADPKQHQAQIERHITQAADQGARLVVLPELHRHAYFCQTQDPQHFALAQPLGGTELNALARLAKQHRIVLIGGLFEKRAPGLYHNSAIVLEQDGSLAGVYRKMHIPDDPGYNEKYYFTPGDPEPAFRAIDTSIGRLGVLICWDQWFPEAARMMALDAAELLIYPTAIGWDRQDSTQTQAQELDAWQTIQRAHAIANQVPVLVANRNGYEASPQRGQGIDFQGIDFWGHSFIVGAQGQWLAQADQSTQGPVLADIDLRQSQTLASHWPFKRDRRIDAYGDLNQRYRHPPQQDP